MGVSGLGRTANAISRHFPPIASRRWGRIVRFRRQRYAGGGKRSVLTVGEHGFIEIVYQFVK